MRSWGEGRYGVLIHFASCRRESRRSALATPRSSLLPPVHTNRQWRHWKACSSSEALWRVWAMGTKLAPICVVQKLAPIFVAPLLLQGVRVRRCHNLPPVHAQGGAKGTHKRLGAIQTATSAGASSRRSRRQLGKAPAAANNVQDCEYLSMPGDLVQRVVEACMWWPEGRTGELKGIVRLVGSGMMEQKGST